MEDTALIDVWDDKRCDWRSVPAYRVVCPECGATYADLVWVEAIRDEPHLECQCGEQFSLTVNRNR